MSFYASRLTNRLSGKKLPTSISEHHSAFNKLRNTEYRPSSFFSSTSDSSSKDPIQEVLSPHNPDHTNWRYVNHRKATTSFQFKATVVVSFFLMPGIAKEVRKFKGKRYFNSNEDPRASTKLASSYQDDLE